MTLDTTLPPVAASLADEPPDLQVEGRLNALARLQRGLVLAVVSLLVAVGVVTWVFLQRSQQQLIEFKALSLAEVVARQAASARTVYAEQVAGKLRKESTGVPSENRPVAPGPGRT
ncbi:MAG: hypothetical protein C0505_12745 [Leptothrix sp. (in: Bacteria)]|nr:hypothetical protein [Leptothrix sp. (in: b-proteobacteria)]